MNFLQLVIRLFSSIVILLFLWLYLPVKTSAFTLQTANMNAEATNNMSVFYWLIAIIGGLIAITLTYVGYRKYKGEERKKKGPNR